MLALMVLFHGRGFVRWVLPGFYILTLTSSHSGSSPSSHCGTPLFAYSGMCICPLSGPLGKVVYFPTGQEVGLQAEPGRKHLPE